MTLVFTLTQCNSQTKTTTTMETSNATQTATKEIIVDVRTIEEWNEDGHADCSVNYPLDQFASKIEELKKYERKALDTRLTRSCEGKTQCSTNLRELIVQVTLLK